MCTLPSPSLKLCLHSTAPLLIVALGLGRLPIVLAAPPNTSAGKPQMAQKYAALPMSFESNQGQTDAQVRFLSRGAGYSILFKEREAVLLLAKGTVARPATRQPGKPDMAQRPQVVTSTDTLHMKLAGALASPTLTGQDPLPGTVNYFVGNDPAQWHTGIPTFERVRYTRVYPGVNLVYYGNRQRLEFDFELAPGADASLIRLQFDGARKLKLDQDGNLVIAAANGSIIFHKPVVYQPIGQGKQVIEGSFRIVKGTTVSFTVGPYDHSKPLVIDPILNYSTYLGSTGEASSIAVDSAGNAYIAGDASVGMPTSTGAFQSAPVTKTGGEGVSAFVAKLNSTGTAVLYCTYLSGSLTDKTNGIAIDASGNAYIAGQTTSTDFPVTTGAFQTANHASDDTSFVAKVNSTGTQLLYSTYLGGSSITQATGIAVDKSGDAYVTGETRDADFPTTKGSFQPNPKSNPLTNLTGFVTEVNPTGKGLVYSTFLSGTGLDEPTAIALDSSNNAYIGGITTSIDFPTTAGAYQVTGKGNAVGYSSGFITEMNPDGNQLVYSTYLGGEYENYILAIALDTSNNVYATGMTSSPDFPVTSGVFQSLPQGLAAGGQDSFVTKLNSTGSALEYSSFLGNGGIDNGEAIAVDAAGNAYIAGNTVDLDFPVTPGALQIVNRETLTSEDGTGFLTKINPSGSQILYSTYLGGSGEEDSLGFYSDSAYGIALDSSANVYLAGKTVSEDFPTTPGAFQLQNLDVGQIAETFVTEFNAGEMTTPPVTTTKIASYNNPQVFGKPVTLVAVVKPTSSSVPTGTVGFSMTNGALPTDLTPWTAVRLDSSGQATVTITPAIAGPIVVNAYYLGDANNAPSSGTMTQNVTQIPTVTTITSSANSVPYGTQVIFTATVVDSSGNPVAGTVLFEMGELVYAQVTLNAAGQATWTNGTGGPYLPAGADTITAYYTNGGPTAGYAHSTGSMTETFTALGVTPAPTFSPAAGTYTSDQSVSIGDASATAVIYFTTDGSTPIAGISPPYLAGELIQVNSSQTIQAIAAAPGYTASSIVSAAYVINLPPPSFTVSGTAVAVAPGAIGGNTSTITVTPSGGFTGSVALTAVLASSPSGAAYLPTFSLGTTTPVNITGTNTGSATLTITTTAPTTGLLVKPDHLGIPWYAAGSTALACIFLFAFPTRLRRWRSMLAMMVLLAALVTGVLSCGGAGGGGGGGGGGGTPGTTAGAYTITLTGASGTTTATGTINLTVQ
jgi:Bacterial Ig-like domain (group 3)/Chitobiase/beta-hexosaminidase C-terminal domain/Beta-propeller repeat